MRVIAKESAHMHTDHGNDLAGRSTPRAAARPEATTTLVGDGLTLGYEGVPVTKDLSIEIPPGKFTVLVGANACGKSTLLRSLARLLKPHAGSVTLDGRDIATMATRDIATQLGILPQTPTAPEGITVANLVSRGRYPHQKWFRQWTDQDDAVVAWALESTGTESIAGRTVDALSGGQRQRVWIAMALAQETEILMLDEPTTYLDVAHQIDVLDLLVNLNQQEGRTIVAVLHDLNLSCRYAEHLIAMRGGEVIAQGRPEDIVTEELVHAVYGLRVKVIEDPVSGTPMVVPIGQHVRYDWQE
jgi:iron complex transport system ATP-binding protein